MCSVSMCRIGMCGIKHVSVINSMCGIKHVSVVNSMCSNSMCSISIGSKGAHELVEQVCLCQLYR